MRIESFIRYLCILPAVLTLACGPSKDTVMTVGALSISVHQAEAYLAGGMPGIPPGQALAQLADRERVLLDPRSTEGTAALSGKIAEIRESTLADMYLRQTAPEAFRGDETGLRAAYATYAESRRIRHILCGTQEEATRAAAALKAGRPFEEVVRGFSKDKGSVNRGGDIGWQRRDRLDPEFASAAFSLEKGKVSEPVKSGYGFHLIQVLEIKSPSDAEFALERPSFEKSWRAQRLETLRHAVLNTKKPGLTIKRSPDALDGTPSDLNNRPGDEKIIIATLGTQEQISLADLNDYMRQFFAGKQSTHVLGASVKKQFLEFLIDSRVIVALGREAGVDRSEAYRAEVWNQTHTLLAAFSEDRFVASYCPSEPELLSYFEQEKGTLAANPECHLALLASSDPSQLERLAKALKERPDRFEAAARQYSVDPETAARGGDIGWVDSSTLANLMGTAAAADVLKADSGAVLGPFATPSGNMILWVKERRNGPPKKFDERRDSVLAAYRQTRRDAIVSRWMSDLRAKYPSKVYLDRLRPQTAKATG